MKENALDQHCSERSVWH